jgi:3-deoxy-7-phosphoheptulonate synthase
MIIILKSGADDKVIEAVAARVRELGFSPHISKGEFRTIIGAIGEEKPDIVPFIEEIVGVERVVQIMKPFKLASRDFHPEDSVFQVGPVKIGAGFITIIAGPCAIESEELLMDVGRAVKAAGAGILRGGAYKPRTSPYAFQGLGVEGLELLAAARDKTGLPVVTELMDPRDLDAVLQYADVVQIGARNMQNFQLLSEVGKAGKPVLLKRGSSATIEELLMAAEYIVKEGNRQVILCERGIRTFETATRNTLDISAVPIIKLASHLPVVVDPSHSAGRLDLVLPLSLAAVAAGADGIIVETHPNPEHALCDGPQSLPTPAFVEYMQRVRDLVEWTGKTVS